MPDISEKGDIILLLLDSSPGTTGLEAVLMEMSSEISGLDDLANTPPIAAAESLLCSVLISGSSFVTVLKDLFLCSITSVYSFTLSSENAHLVVAAVPTAAPGARLLG